MSGSWTAERGALVRTMDLWPEAARRAGLGITRACRIERHDGRLRAGSTTLWYSLPDLGAGEPEEPAEAYLVAAMVQAMSEARALRVHGAVSAELLDNLTEFRDVWHRLDPNRYARIELSAERVTPRGTFRQRGDGVVAPYSGGVDSTFTIWRHLRGLAGHRTRRITHAVLVQGFDIPLADDAAFGSMRRRAERLLGEVGIALVPVRTNFREALPYPWPLVHGPALVSCLQQCRPVCSEGLIASSDTYDTMVLPSGSNVVADPLLASASLNIVHDGAGHDRSAKVREIVNWEAGVAALRVCWEGEHKERNCGACEKCVRTMLSFLANGLPVPECFDRRLTLAAVRRVRLTSAVVAGAWHGLPEAAARNGVSNAWVDIVARKLARRRWQEAVQSARGAARSTFPSAVLRTIERARALTVGRKVARPSHLVRRVPA